MSRMSFFRSRFTVSQFGTRAGSKASGGNAELRGHSGDITAQTHLGNSYRGSIVRSRAAQTRTCKAKPSPHGRGRPHLCHSLNSGGCSACLALHGAKRYTEPEDLLPWVDAARTQMRGSGLKAVKGIESSAPMADVGYRACWVEA